MDAARPAAFEATAEPLTRSASITSLVAQSAREGKLFAAFQKELDGLEEKVSRQVRRMQGQTKRMMEAFLQPLEIKVGALESKQPTIDCQFVDLSGTIKGLANEVQLHCRRSSSSESELRRWKRSVEEDIRTHHLEVKDELTEMRQEIAMCYGKLIGDDAMDLQGNPLRAARVGNAATHDDVADAIEGLRQDIKPSVEMALRLKGDVLHSDLTECVESLRREDQSLAERIRSLEQATAHARKNDAHREDPATLAASVRQELGLRGPGDIANIERTVTALDDRSLDTAQKVDGLCNHMTRKLVGLQEDAIAERLLAQTKAEELGMNAEALARRVRELEYSWREGTWVRKAEELTARIEQLEISWHEIASRPGSDGGNPAAPVHAMPADSADSEMAGMLDTGVKETSDICSAMEALKHDLQRELHAVWRTLGEIVDMTGSNSVDLVVASGAASKDDAEHGATRTASQEDVRKELFAVWDALSHVVDQERFSTIASSAAGAHGSPGAVGSISQCGAASLALGDGLACYGAVAEAAKVVSDAAVAADICQRDGAALAQEVAELRWRLLAEDAEPGGGSGTEEDPRG